MEDKKKTREQGDTNRVSDTGRRGEKEREKRVRGIARVLGQRKTKVKS